MWHVLALVRPGSNQVMISDTLHNLDSLETLYTEADRRRQVGEEVAAVLRLEAIDLDHSAFLRLQAVLGENKKLVLPAGLDLAPGTAGQAAAVENAILRPVLAEAVGKGANCGTCRGTGLDPEPQFDEVVCRNCGGTGKAGGWS